MIIYLYRIRNFREFGLKWKKNININKPYLIRSFWLINIPKLYALLIIISLYEVYTNINKKIK